MAGETTAMNPYASAGLGALGSVVNMAYDAYQQNKQREWNEYMVDKQNAWSLDMWNKTNEYNSPAAQVQRMRDAGLNPLYYGLDGSSANAMQSAQALGYERASAKGMENPLQAGLDSALKTISTRAQEKLALASAHKSESEADLADARAITENLMRNRTYDLMGVQIDLEKANVHLTQEQARKIGADIQAVEKQVEKMDTEIIEAYSRMDVAQRGIALQEATFEFTKWLEGAKLNMQEKEIAVQWYNANTQRLVGEADIELKEEQKAYVQLEGEQVKAVTKTENALREGKVAMQEKEIVAKGIENLKDAREYKYMPVKTAVEVVKGVATATGAIMLGTGGMQAGKGLSKSEKAAEKATKQAQKDNPSYTSTEWY